MRAWMSIMCFIISAQKIEKEAFILDGRTGTGKLYLQIYMCICIRVYFISM